VETVAARLDNANVFKSGQRMLGNLLGGSG
jgi:hypothetical protein